MRKSKQKAAAAEEQQAQQHYLVAPRHLAGGGDLRHITEFLRAAGWKDRSTTGGPIGFENPARDVRVVYDPAAALGGWEILGQTTAHRQPWRVAFSAQVPVEIVAGFTDALTAPRSAHAPNVWAPLQDNGWQARRSEHVTAVSPDGSAFVQYHQPASGEAVWWAGAPTEQGIRAWDATFTLATPMHLIQAFTTALADPMPLMRPRGQVPPDLRIRLTSVSVLPHELAAWHWNRLLLGHAANPARTATATSAQPGRPAFRPNIPADSTRQRR